MRSLCIALVIALALSTDLAAQGVDRTVDASGATSIYTTITQAMAASNPGDRILVLPGTYPPFQFSKGVRVLGMGADPSAVQIERVGVGVTQPQIGYEALLSNVTLAPQNPLNQTALGGNELAPGVLIVDGVRIRGGVFLRGGQAGFYCLLSNCQIDPLPGFGFSGEACYVGGPGNFFELRNSRVKGWNADPQASIPAGLGIRIGGGTQMRITNCRIFGGDGAPAGAPHDAGGDAIVSQSPGLVALRLDGGSIVGGGDGDGTGAGGDGVAISGTVETHSAMISGGAGMPPGLAYAIAQPSSLGADLELAVSPAAVDATGTPSVHSGQILTLAFDPGSAPSVIAFNFAVRLPQAGSFVPLVTEDATVITSPVWSVAVPHVPAGLAFPGIMLYAQAGVVDTVSGSVSASNTVVVRVDLD
jgi:hypothetical protein